MLVGEISIRWKEETELWPKVIVKILNFNISLAMSLITYLPTSYM